MNIVLCFPITDPQVQQIQQVVPEAKVINPGQEGVGEALFEADIFCGHAKVPVDWDGVVRQGRLQWIQSSAAGLDHCLVPAVIASKIPVTSASGLFANQVAEQTMALLYGIVRSMPVFFKATGKKEFIRRPTDDLHGKTIGIVGFGGNGRRIAECLAPLGNRMIATDYWERPCPEYMDAIWTREHLPRLLSESDVVILAVPLNDETHHMIDSAELETMKPGSYLINVARGPVVNEPALIQALESGHLSGAGVDVTEVEPLPEESPLWEMDQVLITPHVGAQSAQRVPVTVDFFCKNLRRYLDGQPLMNLVEKQLGFPGPDSRP